MVMDLLGQLPELFVSLIGLLTGVKSITFVQEGNRGALLVFGKFKRVVEPGFVLVIPYVNELKQVHVRCSTKQLEPQTVTLKDNLSYEVQAVVLFRIVDVYHALFEMADLYGSIKDVGGTILRGILSAKSSEDLHNLDTVSLEMMTAMQQATKSWGVEILSFKLADVAPTNETAQVLIQPKLAAAQLAGTKILVDGIKEIASATDFDGVPSGLVAAMLLRGSGMPTVHVGETDEKPTPQEKTKR